MQFNPEKVFIHKAIYMPCLFDHNIFFHGNTIIQQEATKDALNSVVSDTGFEPFVEETIL